MSARDVTSSSPMNQTKHTPKSMNKVDPIDKRDVAARILVIVGLGLFLTAVVFMGLAQDRILPPVTIIYPVVGGALSLGVGMLLAKYSQEKESEKSTAELMAEQIAGD